MPSTDRPSKLQRTPSNPAKKASFADSVRSYSSSKKQLRNVDFFERDLVLIDEDLTPVTTPVYDYMSTRQQRRMDNEDGPWNVSVVETPHDTRSYSIYVKTPTHNLTLTRTAVEIVELDHKLRDGDFGAQPPTLPLDISVISAATPKRKSTFLNTLSRLTSPTSSKSSRRNTATTPANEIADPFQSFAADAAAAEMPPPSATSTALSAYFTTISNTLAFRQARPWKRFVRVRTDDLESVRVERAIKRVRSDLAAHAGAREKELPRPSVEKPKAEVEPEAKAKPEDGGVPASAEEEKLEPTPEPTATTVEEEAKAPQAEPQPTSLRIRSHSADPDKRLSRAFTSSLTLDGASSFTETGDESSAASSSANTPAGSTTGEDSLNRRGGRKKRSMPTDPAKEKKSQRKVGINDFEMMRVLGKGCAGKVLLVRHKSTGDLYALKAITKRHVLAHQELQHTLTEQAVLKKMAAARERDPFVVRLWWSFHDKENLFLVMDFHPGGDLATQLARWGRLGRDRARFYAAEIVEGVEGLHAAGVIYRDLKPENILIGSDGHIVLTDFGLSKEFPGRRGTITAPATPSGTRQEFITNGTVTPPWMKPDKNGELALGWPGAPIGHTDSTTTFCGTAEYLAPEVIQGLPYSYEIDWWSFGTMLYEMLTGITPFWANNHSEMYVRVLHDELQFPDDRTIDQDTKSLIRGLLQRNPALRICEPRIKRHPYFSMIDWSHVYYKRYIPPYIPPIDPSNASDTQNFDDTFLDMEPVLDDANDDQTDTDQEHEHTDTDRTDGEESNTTPSQSRSSSVHPQPRTKLNENGEEVDLFDGYSFKGRHSVLIDDEEEEEEEGSGGEEDEDVEDEVIGEEVEEEVGEEGLVSETPKPEGEEDEEPKTPEARPVVLPPEEPVVEAVPDRSSVTPEPPTESKPPRRSKDLPRPEPAAETATPPPPPPEKEHPKPAKAPTKAAAAATKGNRLIRGRKEKSGVPALDRYLSESIDEDAGVTEREDDEDDDWDFIEAVDGEDRNGTKGTSLFARGVVDRYRLAVFRKASTPSRNQSRNFSGVSESEADPTESPSPSQRRGRNPGLTFKKHPRQFLRPKSSQPSSLSSKTGSMTSKSTSTVAASNSPSLSAGTSMTSSGFLPPSSSASSTLPQSTPGSPSLKSKESALSVGAQSTSDQSGNGDVNGLHHVVSNDLTKSGEEPEKQKNKKLKKYKENAEKVFSLFSSSSPRQPQS